MASIAYAVPNPFFSNSATPPTASFSYNPKFILVGDIVNFTQKVTGGTPPYSFNWNLGDGSTGTGPSISHRYTTPNTYTVTLNVIDSLGQSSSVNLPVVVNEWPVPATTAFGWVVHWNLTQLNGVNVWNVTYHGDTIIRDARLVAVENIYLNNYCGSFYVDSYNMTGVKADGNISYYQNSTDQSNPYFQLTAEYRAGGFDLNEAFRFYQDGTWEPILTIGRGGCAIIQLYEPHWRIDMPLNEETGNYMSMYTSTGTWQDLLWEGNYTDNGYRDSAHNETVWRYANQGKFYYIKPQIFQRDSDLPSLPSDLILVRDHPNELDHACPFCMQLQSPTEWVNGEPTFRRDIAFWWVPKMYDHGPIQGLTLKLAVIALVFHPGGS